MCCYSSWLRLEEVNVGFATCRWKYKNILNIMKGIQLGNGVDHWEEKENFPRQTKEAYICFVSCNNGPSSVNAGTTMPAIVTAMGWKILSPGALATPGVVPNRFYCDPFPVFKTFSSGKGEKRGEKSCWTSWIFEICHKYLIWYLLLTTHYIIF